MPNVELHGYGEHSNRMEAAILRQLVGHPLASETVIEIYDTRVTTLSGEPSAYLRVVATVGAIGGLLEYLAPLNEDIEVMPLGQWIPKQT